MTHLRLWKFEVPPEQEERFVNAYKADGEWAKLFGQAPGFLRTELWRDGDGIYLTCDYWQSDAAFAQFQATLGEQYRGLDAELEGVAGLETFLGAFDLVD